MKKKFLLGCFAATLAAFILVAFSGFAQEDIKEVHDSGFHQLIRPAVPFDHDNHNAKAGIEDCGTCHHVYENGKKLKGQTSEGEQCSECHLGKGKTSMDLIRAYHDLCKRCHMKEEKGPVICAECHPRR